MVNEEELPNPPPISASPKDEISNGSFIFKVVNEALINGCRK